MNSLHPDSSSADPSHGSVSSSPGESSDTAPVTPSPSSDMAYRAGFVAIIGRPNVGKSTLMNALIRERLSIVTPKPQTTRQRILGILTEPCYQAVFIDTPGLLEPGYKLQELMLHSALRTMEDADVTIAMVDATRGLKDLDRKMVTYLTRSRGPVILAINKIDRVKKPLILPLIDQAQRLFLFAAFVPISALLGDGLRELLAVVIDRLPVGPPLYPPDMLTDQPERFFVAEIIREQLFLGLREELPYSCAVQVEEFIERDRGKVYIRANIFAERESQKAIIIGRQGQMLKQIGSAAKDHIETFLQRPVYLDLWVKVRPTWRTREEDLKELGYE